MEQVQKILKKVGIKKIVLLGIAIVFFILIVNLISTSINNTPTGVVEKFINYADKSKWEKSENLLADRIKNYYKSQGESERLRESIWELIYDGSGELDGYDVYDKDVSEDEFNYSNSYNPHEEAGETESAIVQADLTFDNERVTRSYEFNLVKQDGEWKVLTFSPL